MQFEMQELRTEVPKSKPFYLVIFSLGVNGRLFK